METEEITVESVEELVVLIDNLPDGYILEIDLGKEQQDGS